MGLLEWFDPTRHWEEVSGPAPDPSAVSLQLSFLPFGAPLESASVLGRPDDFRWNSRREKACALLYGKKGLRLQFERGVLTEVEYLIGRDASDHPAFAPSRPMARDGTRLDGDVDRARIVSIFGEPDPRGSDDTCLQVFHGNGVISDFFLDDAGHLRAWALYPDD